MYNKIFANKIQTRDIIENDVGGGAIAPATSGGTSVASSSEPMVGGPGKSNLPILKDSYDSYKINKNFKKSLQ